VEVGLNSFHVCDDFSYNIAGLRPNLILVSEIIKIVAH
jgi:hypothetical protein